MEGWQLSLGFYTGLLFGFYSDKFDDGYSHYVYIPFVFFELSTYYKKE